MDCAYSQEFTAITEKESSSESIQTEDSKKEEIKRSNEPDSEIPCSSTAGHGASDPATESTVSSSSSCCRICQDNGETSEPLETSRCSCKGQLSKVHRSCLIQWVRYKGSNHCEICCGTFRGVSPPANALDGNQLEALETLRQQLVQFQPLSHRKRTALLGFIIFLLLVTGLTGILTFGADREFQRVTGDPYATDHQMKKAHIVFSICLSFLFFAVTLTLGLILLWLFIELFFYIQRRRVLQQAANRMAAELRRRQRAAQGTSL
ncbi:E3 ubiquitin-protein ligase MARCHF11-like [Ruditapes philippinarum]|uniref:E3 ubiquitin-protein ligase MARCHF11-like n=1 Tax=Ruditapes philippinarum TaxID=129788 RepID=UPI00295B915F|nr:E3 ubiquitin-protein ligase MARCHF11-like [Ruditapes philippinarum]